MFIPNDKPASSLASSPNVPAFLSAPFPLAAPSSLVDDEPLNGKYILTTHSATLATPLPSTLHSPAASLRIGILGGGMMGLTLALRLACAGHTVTVLEAAPQVGGLATWTSYGDFVWDRFYHVICPTDEHLVGLINDIGLGSLLRWNHTKTGFLWNGRHISMSNHWEFLGFPALTPWEKARLAAGILYCQRFGDPEELERTPARAWLRRVFGRGVCEVIWDPLLQSKYGTLSDELPATIIWATIRRYYGTREGKGGRERLGFVSGGYKTVFDAMLRAIDQAGGEVLCGHPALAVAESALDGVTVRTPERTFLFDRLISTLPTPVLDRVGADLCWSRRGPAARPRFLGVICLALVLRRALSPFYITNLIQQGFPFTGIIGVSNLTGPEELGGRHLAILPRYDVAGSPYFERDPGEIAAEFIEALRPIWPDIRENVLHWTVNRERIVQALWIDSPPPPCHGPLLSVSGKVWSVNGELTGRDTLNNNAIVKVANEAARDFLARLQDRWALLPKAAA